MKRFSWSQVRSRLEPELGVELRLCLELLWVMPPPDAAGPMTLLPSNVLVGTDGTVQLGPSSPEDFLAQTRYVAPELGAAGGTLASAIYAVGAMLYEAVSGLRFESAEAVAREVRTRRTRAVATGAQHDSLEIRLLDMALRATQPGRHPRWATPESFSRELGRVARGRIATREQLAQLIVEFGDEQQPPSRSGAVASKTPKPQSPKRPSATAYSETTPRIEVFVSSKRRFPAVEVTGPLRPSDDRAFGSSTRHTVFASTADPSPFKTLRGFSLDLSQYPGKSLPQTETPPSSSSAAADEVASSPAEPQNEPASTSTAPTGASKPDVLKGPIALPVQEPTDFEIKGLRHRARVAAIITTGLVAAALVFLVVRGSPSLEPQPPSVLSISPALTESGVKALPPPVQANADVRDGDQQQKAVAAPAPPSAPDSKASIASHAPAVTLRSTATHEPPTKANSPLPRPEARGADVASRPASPPPRPKSKQLDYPDYGI